MVLNSLKIKFIIQIIIFYTYINMEKNNLKYNQCYWYANGNMVCQKLDIPYEPNRYKGYVDFKNFSTPTKNYDPNGYRRNIEYYEAPNNYTCNVACKKCERPANNNYEWLSPPQTLEGKRYFLNNQIPDTPNNYFPSS